MKTKRTWPCNHIVQWKYADPGVAEWEPNPNPNGELISHDWKLCPICGAKRPSKKAK